MKKRVLCLVLCFMMIMSAVSLSVSAASYADANKVKEIWIEDVQTPYAGCYPDYDFTIRSSSYTFNADSITNDSDVVNGCWWYDQVLKRDVAPDEVFVKDHTYTLVMLLETYDGYEFNTENLKAYINGDEAIIIPNYTSKNTAGIKIAIGPCEESPDKSDGVSGDANCDTEVNIKDATAIQKHVAGLITLTDAGVKLADVDANTSVNIKDATAIQKHIAGIDTGFDIGNPV